MIKHLMARLLILSLLTFLILSSNVAVSMAAPTSGVKNEISVNEQSNNSESFDMSGIIADRLKVTFKVKNINKVGYLKTEARVYKKPAKKSKVLTTFSFNKKIKYVTHSKKWVKIKYKKKFAYIAKRHISKKKMKYKEYSVPKYSGYKSWMPYTAITASGSPQYKMQRRYGYTGKYGIRMVKGRFCVAIGSHFKIRIGQYFDLVLANGTVIKCILGDEKADRDTDGSNIFSRNGCCSEFLIDRGSLARSIRLSGDVSSACKKWKSRVKKIRIYKKNIMK